MSNNNERINVMVGGIAGFGLLFFSALSVIRGGLINIGFSVLLLSPFAFILFCKLRSKWCIVLPVLLVAGAIRIPMRGIEQLSLIHLFLFGVSLIYVLDVSIGNKKEKSRFELADRLILIIACILTARMIYDRPGFVAVGSAEGGFFKAFSYVSAPWLYFAAKKIVSDGYYTRKQLVQSVVFVLFICIYVMIKGDRTDFFFRPIGSSPFWMLCAMMLSLFSTSSVPLKRTIVFYLTALGFMLGGIVSGYRSRLFFFFSESMVVSWMVRRFKRDFLILGLAGIFSIIGLILVTGEVPDLMRRFLTLFMDVEMGDSFVGGQLGWTDTFRGSLYEIAWKNILRHPIVGNGLGLNVNEALQILSIYDENTQIQFLALTGSYHNSIVELAVKCGLPVAILVFFVIIIIPFRFFKALYRMGEGDLKLWGTVILSYWSANLLMLLMNGGDSEFTGMVVVLGIMMGLMKNPAVNSSGVIHLEGRHKSAIQR